MCLQSSLKSPARGIFPSSFFAIKLFAIVTLFRQIISPFGLKKIVWNVVYGLSESLPGPAEMFVYQASLVY